MKYSLQVILKICAILILIVCLSFSISIPLFKTSVPVDFLLLNRELMMADSLEQPLKAIELSKEMYNRAALKHEGSLQLKAAIYKFSNEMKLDSDGPDRDVYIHEFDSLVCRITSPDYQALGILYYLTNINQWSIYDKNVIENQEKNAIRLLNLLPELNNTPSINYAQFIRQNWMTQQIAPTLDLYIATCWLDLTGQFMNNTETKSKFYEIFKNSGWKAANLIGEYLYVYDPYLPEQIRKDDLMAMINKYQDLAVSGFLYPQLSNNNPKKMELIEEYCNRFPASPFTRAFKFDLEYENRPEWTVTYPLQVSSEGKGEFSVIMKNKKKTSLKIESKNTKQVIRIPLYSEKSSGADTLNCLFPNLTGGKWYIGFDDKNDKDSLFSGNIANYSFNNNIYAVDFITGEPLKAGSVKFRSSMELDYTFQLTDGICNLGVFREKYNNLDNIDGEYRIYTKKDSSLNSYSNFWLKNESNREFYCDVLINKPVFKPGDEVLFKGWCWNATHYETKLPEKQSFQVYLKDNNFKPVDTCVVTIDQYGTFSGTVKIPSTGMKGSYTLISEFGKKYDRYGSPYHHYSNRTEIPVYSYQAPSFRLMLKSRKADYTVNEKILIDGEMLAFNGLPQPECGVRYNITFDPDYSFMTRLLVPFSVKEEINGATTTDKNGKFTITINASEKLKRYVSILPLQATVTVNATNQAGETEMSNYRFMLSQDPYFIKLSGGGYLDQYPGEKKNSFKIYACTMDEMLYRCEGEWTLSDLAGKKMLNGTWISNTDTSFPDLSGLKPGTYKLNCVSDEGLKDSAEFIIYNSCSCAMPVDSTLIIIPHIHKKSVLIGTSEKELFARVMWITEQNADNGEWIRLSNGLREWKLPEIKTGEKGLLKVIAVRIGKLFAKEHHIENPLPKDSIDVKIATFRDHLTPGSKDTWTISLSQKGRPVSSASTLAFMYDASLDEIIKHNPVLSFRRPELYLPDYLREGSCFSDKSIYNRENYSYDFHNLFDYSKDITPAFTFSMKRNPFTDSKLHYGLSNNSIADVFIEEEISSAVDRDIKTGDMGNTPTLRSNFADCAFFYPNLPVRSDGKVTFSFTLPDLITTWRFVAIANNNKMDVGQIEQSFVAKKELMLQINEPRFLRQGDQTEIEATVSFLKPHSGATTVTMELVNAITEKVVSSAQKQISGQEQVLKVNFPVTVPVNTDRIILRMQASNSQYSDGEQYLIPVLSSDIALDESMDVSTGGHSDMTFQWKELNKTVLENTRSLFRIEVVKNPAWYSVSALSASSDDDCTSASAIANTYFANTLGEVIAKANPGIESYLMHKAKSPLHGKVANTPWVNQEEQETKQIEEALQLYNPGRTEYLRYKAFNKLSDLQHRNGGFAWFPGMRPSLWETMEVLIRFGILRELKVIEFGVEETKMQRDALKFIDKEMADIYTEEVKNKTADGPIDVIHVNLMYIRSLFKDIPLSEPALKAQNNWVMRATKSWIGNNLYTKSFLANILFTYGYSKEAKEIVSSILNHGVKSPTLGFWFPSNKYQQLQTQVAVMRLMLNPQVNRPDLFEEMKWWIIAQKLNRKWETNAATVNAVYALTMQGQNVLNTNGTLSVMLGTKELKSHDDMILSQPVTIPELIAAKGVIRVVNNTANPVFGGLYRKYEVPVKSVKGNNSGALQIRKEIIRNNKEPLKVGEEITIRLIVKSSQALGFVQIQDQLAACFQPANQKSGYIWQRQPCYKELNNENINFFIETLPRGTSVFEYKVWINRPGTYQSGVAKVISVYNPQYVNYSDNYELKVK